MGFLSEFSRTRQVSDRPGHRARVRFVIEEPDRRMPGDTPRTPVDSPGEVGAGDTAAAVTDAPEDVSAFDPGEHPVAVVLAYLRANRADTARVQALEAAGRARATILAF